MTLTQVTKAGLDELALDHVFTVGASGTDHYTFQGEGLNGTVNDPTLYLTRGKTYRFEKGSAHPLRIQSTAGASGTAYNTGVTNNGGTGTVIIEVQHDAPDVLYYQCTSHANMNGILYITGALADGGVTTTKLADDAVNNDKLANSIVAEIAANTAKDLTALSASNLTSGTVPDARIGASSVTQHVTAFDDNKIINDISSLALKVNALGNATRYNTNSLFVDTFQDSEGIDTFTTSGRDSTGEYLSSVYDAVTNITAGWHGGGTNTTGDINPAAGSYQGIDGVTRSKGQIVGNGNFPGYNGFCYGHVFGASDNFELIFSQRGNWQAGGRIHGTGLTDPISSSIGTFRTEPPSSLGVTFTSYASNLSMSGGYPLPDGPNGGTTRTIFYRYFRDNGSVTCTYTESSTDISFGATQLAALRASTDTLGNFGSATTINDKMLIITGEAGATEFLKVEMANTFAETTSATGTVVSNVITAPSSISKMGAVITYTDTTGTATINTDIKLYVSADNGSNYTQVTLVAQPNFSTGVKMALANDVSVTAGTQLRWKLEFANQATNSKITRVTGVSLQF